MSFTLIRFWHYSVYCFPHYCGYTILVFQGTRTRLWRGRGGKCEARGGGVGDALLPRGVVGVRRDDKERRRGRLR
jgi:hypothetical protein